MSEGLVSRVFAHLCDGNFHSGEELALALGVTRSAVWKVARTLRELGVSLEAVRNKGYRLANPGEPLQAAAIRAAIPRGLRDRIRRLEVEWSLDSTNTALGARASPPPGACEVLLAEFQTAGRGRRGRSWLSSPGGSICLSLSWTFAQMPRDAGALSLAIGVCVLRALRTEVGLNAQLKWPNDILIADRKLGGILIELRAESAGPASAVVGIGLNVALGNTLLEQIAASGVPAADLISAGVTSPARNRLAAHLIEACIRGLLQFEQEGLRPFVEEWRHADALRGRPVAVQAMEEGAKGLARGIDLSGALLVETPHGLKKFFSGDVTVRSS